MWVIDLISSALQIFPGVSGGCLIEVKNLPANAGSTRDMSLTPESESSPEEGMATHCSSLAWRIPWTEEPGGLQSMGSQRARHDWAAQHTSRHSGDEHEFLVMLSIERLFSSLPLYPKLALWLVFTNRMQQKGCCESLKLGLKRSSISAFTSWNAPFGAPADMIGRSHLRREGQGHPS